MQRTRHSKDNNTYYMDGCEEGPLAGGLDSRHLKAPPALHSCLVFLTLDSCHLGAFLLCPHPDKVHLHSTLWKDSVHGHAGQQA